MILWAINRRKIVQAIVLWILHIGYSYSWPTRSSWNLSKQWFFHWLTRNSFIVVMANEEKTLTNTWRCFLLCVHSYVSLAYTFWLHEYEYCANDALWKQSIKKSIYVLTGMEKVRDSTETWFSPEFLFGRIWWPPICSLSLGIRAFSSAMPFSPEYSAEWVGHILIMCFWGPTWDKKMGCSPVNKGILGRLQKVFPPPGEIRGTHK